jgi:transcriptional regulator with XRE-family HTH domain
MPEAPKLHIGRKIERIRTLRGVKQETLAATLGITQAAVSKMEQGEKVNEDKLKQVADALGVTVEAIKNFDENATINNNIYDQNNTVINYQFNPIDKLVALFEENKKLYERLLESERKRCDLLESLLNKKDKS